MASLSPDHHVEAAIETTEQSDGVTLYVITISVGTVKWTVKQRYNAFAELHDKLVSNHGLARDLLPPKKIIGNKDPAFIEKRRIDLQLYLQARVFLCIVRRKLKRMEGMEWKAISIFVIYVCNTDLCIIFVKAFSFYFLKLFI